MAEVADQSTWSQVKAYLGESMARYVLAVSKGDTTANLSAEQSEVANTLVRMFASSQLEAWNPLLRMHDIASVLCTHDPSLGLTRATYLHFYSGGQAAAVHQEDDELEAALCRLALDVYPLFLIGGRGDGSQFDVTTLMWSNPQRQTVLEKMFQAEEPLMKLFPNADFADDPTEITFDLTSYARWSNGDGGTIQMTAIPQAILLRAPGAFQEGLSPLNSYLHSVRETLKSARNLAEGREAKIPAIVGCYSISFADDLLELALDGARFRRKTAIDNSLLAESPHEEIILEVDVSLKAARPAEPKREKWPTTLEPDNGEGDKFHENLQDRVDRARLAILLSSGDDEVLAVGQSFMSVPNPLSLGVSWGKSPLAWPIAPFLSRQLVADDAERVREWDQILSQLPTGMRTGAQRLLSAVSERYSPHDGFIDAVIVWESLFGAAGETMLRVCGSLAALLRPGDQAQRAEFFKKIKKMYGQRSRLVHGGEIRISVAEATELRNTAVHIAMEAWRAVVKTPGLKSAKDSEERGMLVLIHGAG